jgi:two-component system sensor histidine kinase/response regulator
MTKVLAIEDETAIRENLVELLEMEEFEVFSAENGQKGVELALKHQPDLILCDVMMPELDGYGVLDRLRKNSATATIPFIFLTALSDKTATRKGMELGADDYLTKPFSHKELLSAIASRLRKQNAIAQQAQEKLDRLRDNIIHSLPHELRTPLNGILGFSELLMLEIDDLNREEIQDMAQQIQTSAQRLYRLIQNYLLYAELELIASHPERLEALRQESLQGTEIIIAEAARRYAQKYNRNEDLHLNLQPAVAAISMARFQKMIEETIDNAFKFSQAGTPVKISLSQDAARVTIAICDQGRGMNNDQIANIGAYMQFERKLYEQQGSGLGLSIAKRLAELHGGQLILESIADRATTLEIILPAGSID